VKLAFVASVFAALVLIVSSLSASVPIYHHKKDTKTARQHTSYQMPANYKRTNNSRHALAHPTAQSVKTRNLNQAHHTHSSARRVTTHR
jgi:hypothetical protein